MAYNNSHSVMLGQISSYLNQCCRNAYEQGIAEERKEWELAAGELLVKYAGDIYEALPDMVEKIQTKAYEKGRADAIEEVITLARAEIDFESQAEQKRFVEFMEQLKE